MTCAVAELGERRNDPRWDAGLPAEPRISLGRRRLSAECLSPALGAQRRTASVIAVDDVEAGFLHGDEFRTFLREHPDAALVLIRMLVRRLAEADRDRVALATQDSVGRVAKRLLDLAADHGVPAAGGTRIELALTQDELARWTGATRETVSRALRLMRQLGWVSTDHRTITVLDAAALRDRVGEGGANV